MIVAAMVVVVVVVAVTMGVGAETVAVVTAAGAELAAAPGSAGERGRPERTSETARAGAARAAETSAVLHPPPRLIVTDGDQRLLDQCNDVRRLGVLFTSLTVHFHVCNHTFGCNSTYNKKGVL